MALAPTPGSYVAVFYGSGAGSSYSDEAMEEVDLTDQGYARYTVYRITDADKRALLDSEAPVFEWQDGGVGEFSTLTPSEIWYGAGYIVLSSALDGTDVVQCASGKYLSPTQISACKNRTYKRLKSFEDVTCYGDEAAERFPTIKDWNATIDTLHAGICATLTTTGGNANSHIRLIHFEGGVAGNSITLTMTNPGGTGTIAVTVTGTDIDVTLAVTDGSITSTAEDVVQALNADVDVRALKVRAEVVSGETGAGIVAALEETALSGGLGAIDWEDLDGVRLLFQFYDVEDSGIMCVGFGYIESVDWPGGPDDLTKAILTISGAKHPMYRVVE